MFWYKHCSLCCSSSVQNALLIIEIHLIFPLSIYIYVSSVYAGLYLHFYVLTLGWCTCVDASTVCDWGVDNVQTVNLFFFFYLVAIVWTTISIHIFNCRKAHENTSKCFLFFRIIIILEFLSFLPFHWFWNCLHKLLPWQTLGAIEAEHKWRSQ